MHDKLVSIVLPTYNGSQYIEEAINSILNQTYTDFELIIVNDCSTDNTRAIAEQYAKKDTRIKIIHNEVNRKLPASLNIGFEHAKGEYFTWTSDDNKYKSNALEVMVDELEQHKDCSLAFSNYDVINQEGVFQYERICMTESMDEILYGNIVGASFLYKRSVHFALEGYDESKFLIEDYDFWLRAYQQFKFRYINQNLYEYRIHDTSLTKTRNEQIQKATIELLERVLNNDMTTKKQKYQIALSIAERYRTGIPNMGKRIHYMRIAQKYGPCHVLKILTKECIDRITHNK